MIISADILIRSNTIFDSVKDAPFQGFVAVKGNKILSVGKGSGDVYITPETKVVEAGDKIVMAGFHDNHVHMDVSGMYQSYVNLADAKSEEETVQKIKDFYDKNDDGGEWIIGFSWYHIFWDDPVPPTKKSLDKYFPDRPVFLLNAEGHGCWVNSKALSIADVDKDTPDPPGGKILKDENGEPTGVLIEAAGGLVSSYALNLPTEKKKDFIRLFMEKSATLGITSGNDLMPYYHGGVGELDEFRELDRDGELTMRIHVAPNLLSDLDKLARLTGELRSDTLRVGMTKEYMDGVPTTHTAILLEGYETEPGNLGTEVSDVAAINKAVPEAHKRGLSVKLHCCGDGAVRNALDAFEKAISVYGQNGCRHSVEHVEMISPEDIPRFAALGVVASVQPEHMAITNKFEDNSYPIELGKERAENCWPLKSIHNAGAVLAFGSDCPVVDSNPFMEIYRAVTRLHNDGEPKGGWKPSEKLTLAEALKAYTYGSAYAVGRESEMGTLEAGKFADIIVLDKNYFAAPQSEIIEGKVDLTIMNGNVIFENR